MKKKDLWVALLTAVMMAIFASCQVNDQELGEDLLPPGDSVLLFHDTIFDISVYPVTCSPPISSDIDYDNTRLWLLGESSDSITGKSRASLITQFNTTSQFRNGPNMEIDSLVLYLYMDSYVGNTDDEITVSVYEMSERIYKDSVYYSDYSVEDKYFDNPLAVKTFSPVDASTEAIVIEDEDYLNKFLDVQADTSYFRNDSVFKDYFKGFYLVAETASPEGVLAKVGLSNTLSRLSIKYFNDSTDIDTTEGPDVRWTNFTINEFASQKINIFDHDFSGTYLSTIIDDESANSPYCYVQGMSGVNTVLSFDFIPEWMEKSPIAINSANLVFDVVPEEESGIPYEDLPERLMIHTLLEDGKLEPVYDVAILIGNGLSDEPFGGKVQEVSEGLFSDSTYVCRFDMKLHMQAMVEGENPEQNFILKLENPNINPEISKLWGNLPSNNKRIRLEVVYLKLNEVNSSIP